MSKPLTAHNGMALPIHSVLTREDARGRQKLALNCAETYRGCMREWEQATADAATDEQRRIARGYWLIAERTVAFEVEKARLYGELVKGSDIT